MRQAMADAEVGDEQKREDPTVNLLEARAAAMLGQEEAVYVPTATMANEIALRLHGEPGDEMLAEEHSHVLIAELGGPAALSGFITRPLPGDRGRLSPDQIRGAARLWDDRHTPITRIVSIENTHNSSGGCVWPLEEVSAIADTCRELGLRLHLDGARLFNAAVALGLPAAEISRHADTVTICLSKGLGCPLGALVAGSSELMNRARRFKHLFGGAMRQAGIVAAAGVYALDHNVERLAEDHARAGRLADGLAAAGLPVRSGRRRDELRPARRRLARSRVSRCARAPPSGRRRSLGDDPSRRAARPHPPGRDGRRHRPRDRARPPRPRRPRPRIAAPPRKEAPPVLHRIAESSEKRTLAFSSC